MEKVLSIGMATYDDFDGVYFTIQALKMYHNFCNGNLVEFVVLDNNPTSEHGRLTKNLVENNCKNGTYISKEGPSSSFDKYKIVDHASGKYVIIIDPHVLLTNNFIGILLQYYLKNPDCKDLVQGPLIYDDLHNYATHFDKKWSGEMYGVWGSNKIAHDMGEPFEIEMQGMGFCSFERKNFPGINQEFKGFGGEEGYIAEKFRQNGGKNICIPQLKWCHRFGRPGGAKYPLILEDRIWNYFLGWLELTKNPEHEVIQGAYEHFKDRIPAGSIDTILNKAKQTIGI